MTEAELKDLHNVYWKDYFPFTSSFENHINVERCLSSGLRFDSVLEIGVGNGDGLKKFLDAGRAAVGIEYSKHIFVNLLVNKFKLGQIYEADAANLPFPDNSFDMVCSFDVLEHLPEDRGIKAVKEIHRVVKKYFYGTISNRIDHYKKFHLNVKPHEWWVDLFVSVGFKNIGTGTTHIYEK